MVMQARSSALIAGAMIAFGALPVAPAAADAVADAKAAVAKYAGPQTTWEGPTTAPKPEPGKKIVFLSGDEQNDISHLYGVYIKQAGEKLGWKRDHHRRQGQPDLLARRHEPGDRAEAGRHRHVRRRGEPAGPDQGRRRAGHQVRRPACRRTARARSPTSISFVNIQEDPREIGKAEADWAIADSNGKAHVVILSHNEYAIAEVKSMATKAEIEKCPGCKVLDYVNSPASEAAQRQPQLTTSWVQRFGLPLYATSVGDNDWDFAVPVLALRRRRSRPGQADRRRRQPLGL